MALDEATRRDGRTPRPPATPPPDGPGPRVREPARSIFVPIATALLSELTRAVAGFQQALFVLTLLPDVPVGSGARPRLVALLVAIDATGMLRAIEPSAALLDGAARMVDADRADGNAPWRKLSARITPKPDGGATLHSTWYKARHAQELGSRRPVRIGRYRRRRVLVEQARSRHANDHERRGCGG